MEEEIEEKEQKKETLADVIEAMSVSLETQNDSLKIEGDIANKMWKQARKSYKETKNNWKESGDKVAKMKDIIEEKKLLKSYVETPVDDDNLLINHAALAAVQKAQKDIVEKEISKFDRPLKEILQDVQENEIYADQVYDVVFELKDVYDKTFKSMARYESLENKVATEIAQLSKAKLTGMDKTIDILEDKLEGQEVNQENFIDNLKDRIQVAALKEARVQYHLGAKTLAERAQKEGGKKDKRASRRMSKRRTVKTKRRHSFRKTPPPERKKAVEEKVEDTSKKTM